MLYNQKISNLRWFRLTTVRVNGHCPTCQRPQTLLAHLEPSGIIGKDKFFVCWNCQTIKQLDAAILKEPIDPQVEEELGLTKPTNRPKNKSEMERLGIWWGKKHKMSKKFNRTVPIWVKAILFSLCLGTFIKVLTETSQQPWESLNKGAYMVGTVIGLVLLFFVLNWLMGWFCGLIRIAITRK